MARGTIAVKDKLYTKMLALFVVIIVLPALIIGIWASNYSINNLVEKSTSSYGATIDNLQETLESELFETKMSAYYMYLDLELKEAISSHENDPSRNSEKSKALREKFDNYKISTNFSSVNAIKVYGFNGFTMSFGEPSDLLKLDDSEIVLSDWYQEAIDNPDEFIWTGLQSDFGKEEDNKTISIFRVIKDRSYTKDIGMMYVNLDPQIFTSLSDKFSYSETSQIYILDNSNQTVSSLKTPGRIIRMVYDNEKDYEDNYSVIIDEGDEKFFINYISEYDWKIIGVLPVDEITKGSREVFRTMGMVFLLFLFLASLIWVLVIAKVFRPINELTDATKKIRNGDFSVQVEHESQDEIGLLTNNFNFMVHKINDLMDEVVEENTRMKDSEYKALQAQINPHFLYNTLNSIRWMAIIQKADNIKKVVDALGRLLRNSTSKMDQYITVSEEVANLQDYIYIQKIAYNNKFSVQFDIDDETLNLECLKFILQPLVENAIFHGILPKETYGSIDIRIVVENEKLIFEVKDDGVGMTADEIEVLLVKDSEQSRKFNGIGIHSIYERILMAYDGDASMKVYSEKDNFTKIRITIPIT